MSSNWNKKHAWVFWKRFALAMGLVFAVAAAYAAKQSAEQSKPAPSPETSHAQPAFNGTWKLNREQSDDPREKLRSAMQDRDRNGPMGGHGGMGGGGVTMGIPGIGGIGGMGRPGGRPGGGQGRGPGAGSEDQRARLRDLVEAPDQLKILQKGPEIDMTDTESHVRSLFTDGRKLEKPKKDSSETQVKARWDRETLITEEKGPNGEKISHSYEITDGGKQLADTLTLESKKLNTPIIVRSVYDRAEGDQGE
ncbi:MAG: hypothetical protein WA628_02775 [Terriglobales bacterium]